MHRLMAQKATSNTYSAIVSGGGEKVWETFEPLVQRAAHATQGTPSSDNSKNIFRDSSTVEQLAVKGSYPRKLGSENEVNCLETLASNVAGNQQPSFE